MLTGWLGGNLHLTSISKLLSAEPSVKKGIPVFPPSLIPNLTATSSTSASVKFLKAPAQISCSRESVCELAGCQR